MLASTVQFSSYEQNQPTPDTHNHKDCGMTGSRILCRPEATDSRPLPQDPTACPDHPPPTDPASHPRKPGVLTAPPASRQPTNRCSTHEQPPQNNPAPRNEEP
jgi:hypothetical protein